MLRIIGLTKTYNNGKRAVDSLSLEISPGDIYGFIGHNGAGKTTTLKCIAGILGFEGGEIVFEGKSIKKEPLECKQHMAYIPDNPDLYENMKGIRFLSFIADIYGLPKEKREQKIKELADEFELTKNLGDMISSYSHGMKQKLALISAFMREPRLLLLDEPFVGLDPLASHVFKANLKKFCDGGGAVFFSTHVLEVAEKLCNKIAVIKGGRLEVCGEMAKVKGDSSLENLFLELSDNEK